MYKTRQTLVQQLQTQIQLQIQIHLFCHQKYYSVYLFLYFLYLIAMLHWFKESISTEMWPFYGFGSQFYITINTLLCMKLYRALEIGIQMSALRLDWALLTIHNLPNFSPYKQILNQVTLMAVNNHTYLIRISLQNR